MTTITAIGPATGVFRGVLDGFKKDVDDTIQKAIADAKDAGTSILVEAGRQVSLAIDNVKNAYDPEMTKTVDKISKAASLSMDHLNVMVQDLQSKNEEMLDKLEARSQQLINTLPFIKRQPQVNSVMPRYAAIAGKDKTIHFSIKGNFLDAATKGYEPKLTFENNNEKYIPVASTTDSLEFEVPISALISSVDGSMHKRSYCVGSLTIPWIDKGYLWNETKNNTYKVWLGALPLAPGNIVVDYTANKTERIFQRFKSQVYKVWADDFHPQKWVTQRVRINPDPGWSFKTGTVTQPILGQEEGSHTQVLESVTKDEVVVVIGESAIDGKHMGRITFHIEADEYKEVSKQEKRSENIELKWGDSKALEPKEGEEFSKLTFDSFDGKHIEMAGENVSDPYVKLRTQGGKYVVKAEVPKDIVSMKV